MNRIKCLAKITDNYIWSNCGLYLRASTELSRPLLAQCRFLESEVLIWRSLIRLNCFLYVTAVSCLTNIVLSFKRDLKRLWYISELHKKLSEYSSTLFGEGKGSSQKHLDLYAHRISYQLKESRFGPFLTHSTIGFNPIRARVRIKSSHHCLLIHYYSINNI